MLCRSTIIIIIKFYYRQKTTTFSTIWTVHSCSTYHEHNLATHGLSCQWSEGHHHRHAEMNGIMKRALTSAKVPSCLEASGLHRADGKRPDGIMVVPGGAGSEAPHLGCDLPGHLCPLILSPCHQWGRDSSSTGRGKEGGQVYMSTSPQSISSPQLQWRQWVFLVHAHRRSSGT